MNIGAPTGSAEHLVDQSLSDRCTAGSLDANQPLLAFLGALAESHLVWWQSNGVAMHKAAMAHAHGGGQSTTLNERGTSSIRGYADHGAPARDSVERSVHDPVTKRLAGACTSKADGRRLGGGRHHAEFFSAGHQPVSAGRMYGDTMGKVPSHARYSPAEGPSDKGGY